MRNEAPAPRLLSAREGEVSLPKSRKSILEPAPYDWELDWGSVIRDKKPSLTFAPTAWAKIQYFLRNGNDVEISGFGISRKDDLLVVEDFALLKQESQTAFVTLDDEAIANHVEDCLDKGISPDRCARIWIHTHPGMSTTPSSHDWKIFRDVFGRSEWAVMCILTETGASAHLSLSKPFKMEIGISALPDYGVPIEAIDYEALAREYKEKITPVSWKSLLTHSYLGGSEQNPYIFRNDDFLDNSYWAGLEDLQPGMEGHHLDTSSFEECGYCGEYFRKETLNALGVCTGCAHFLNG